jgi:hypothetical protein
MKRLIAVISAVAAIGFAVALANTSDVNTSSSGTSDVHEQSAGIHGGDLSGTPGDMSGTAGGTTSDTTGTTPGTTTKGATTSSDRWSTARTCTDENGVTFYKGRTGFDGCVSKMRKMEKKDQMGGTIPRDETTSDVTNSDTTATDSDSTLPSDSSISAPGQSGGDSTETQ